MGGSKKGSAYEREVCTKLSLWWTGGQRDDVFWRSAGSGARATNRAARGLSTAGQYGDIAATDPIGAPFINQITVEIKRGYRDANCHDMLDKLPTAKVQVFEGFVAQAINSSKDAGTPYWLLITRRDRRVAMAWWPSSMTSAIIRHTIKNSPERFVRLTVPVEGAEVDIDGATLDSYLQWCQPTFFKQ